ncbi:3-methyl-2-oxobutanoate hydroxymethyltransferase [Pseudozobellia thermophila]|uniref:Lumazine-binding n=1 Tax=Pseudozobellia thermophila TaxID=192903 RepID=A0A1M6F467_9FLAO|nr:3-methyl-2-oxobutanoate hydroxymethyltransferase [Pseudozobellia thermophila]SHI92518.1 hypothetical protein SAMN04488513_102290 [Pseudozobellia thermophila]
MKNLVMAMFLLICFDAVGQNGEETEVRRTIDRFFDGFHKQDSLIIKETVSESIVLQTIANNEQGEALVKSQEFSAFLKSLVGIPKTTKFQEVITDWSIQIDGPMAHAWTDYEFKVDDAFHHCGVNSFQLVKDAEKGWQIIYLIDTRRKTDCK